MDPTTAIAPITINPMVWVAGWSVVGCVAGIVVAWLSFRQRRCRAVDFPGLYVGALPVLGAAGAAMSALPALPDGAAAPLLTIAAAVGFLGTLRDVFDIRARHVFPYYLLLLLVGVGLGVRYLHVDRLAPLLVSIAWPAVVFGCLKLAGLVYEMPFLLSAISGTTCLLFFSTQTQTPPEAVVVAMAITVVGLLLHSCGLLWMRLHLGDGGKMALAYLLAGASLLGQSKSLLMFGLLLPSMVIIYPLVLVSGVVMTSYLSNELYRPSVPGQTRSFSWSLPRAPLVVTAALVFLALNFAMLLRLTRGPGWAWALLVLLMVGCVVSTARVLRRRAATDVTPGAPVEILGTSIANVTPAVARERIVAFVATATGLTHVVTADSLAVMRAQRDPAFARILARAELVVPDGAGLVWAADFLGRPVVSRVPGVALVEDLCHEAATRQWRIAIVGAEPGVADRAAALLRDRHPGLTFTGIWHGFFGEGSQLESDIIAALQTTRPQLLFVAMGVPRQERWINRMRNVLPPLVAIGIGGSLDVISGSIPRAPVWMQRFALEWLYRLWREPSRYRRMLGIPLFVLAIFRHKWRG